MNQHAKWRLELARNLSKQLSAFNGIRAIAAGGSAARGGDTAFARYGLEQPTPKAFDKGI